MPGARHRCARPAGPVEWLAVVVLGLCLAGSAGARAAGTYEMTVRAVDRDGRPAVGVLLRACVIRQPEDGCLRVIATAVSRSDGTATVSLPDSSYRTGETIVIETAAPHAAVVMVMHEQTSFVDGKFVTLEMPLRPVWILRENFAARSVCSAFQPREMTDRYVLIPNHCGRGRFLGLQ